MERQDLADALDVNIRTYSKWENGQGDPPLGQLLRISEILNCTLTELLGIANSGQAESFNNNTQEGENCVMYNASTIAFDRVR
jgi:transcriptional regulator with XRE-family HTH domain